MIFFSLDLSRCVISTGFITGAGHLEHFCERVSAKFIHSKVYVFLLPHPVIRSKLPKSSTCKERGVKSHLLEREVS